MTKRRLFEQADFVFSTIQEMGINLNPSSRIAAMRNTMCFPDGSARPTISFDDPKFETVREGIRDIQQLNFIFDKLSALDDLEGKAKIRRLIKDSVRPQDDKKASFGRDVQFELFVASICAVADLRPRLQEPDVVFHVDGSQFCFAIKRLQNEERLEQRVKEATHQIVKADIPGLIVMDISRALNKENEPIDRPVSEAEFAVAAKRMIAEFERRHEEKIIEITRGQEVRGAIIHDSHIVRSANGGYGLTTVQFPVSCSKRNQRRDREFATIYDRYSRAIPGTTSL